MEQERVVNEKLCWRDTPGGKWIEYTQEELTRRLLDDQQRSKEIYEKAPWWTNPDLSPMTPTCKN